MSLLNLLQSGVVLVSDGAMGTELQKRGMPTGVCPEEMNVSRPDIIRSIHHDYYAAGADLVETNSFGANKSRLTLHGFEERGREFCVAGARLAKQECPPGKFVAGSVGPTGDLLEPLGPRTLEEAETIFTEQTEALAEGGVDLIVVETMMAAEEAEIAVRAAKRTRLPVAATMTFEKGKAGLRTMWGVDVATAVNRLTDAGADVLGANCGRGFDEMIEIVREMRPMTTLPILAQSNAGLPEWADGVSLYKETPELVAPRVRELLGLGVNIIGGCCGTGPEHIALIRRLVDAHDASPWFTLHFPDEKIVEVRQGRRPISSEQAVLALVAECGSSDTQQLLIHMENVDPAFFDLSTGFAGMMLQKFSNYHIRMAMTVDPSTEFSPRFKELMNEAADNPDFHFFAERTSAVRWLLAGQDQ